MAKDKETNNNDLSEKIIGTTKGLGKATKKAISNKVDKSTTGMEGSIFYVFRWLIAFFGELANVVKTYFAERREYRRIEKEEHDRGE